MWKSYGVGNGRKVLWSELPGKLSCHDIQRTIHPIHPSFFSCPYQGCALSFKRHSNLENHLHIESVSCAKKSSPWKIKRNCSMFKNLQKVLVSSLSYTAQAQTLKAPRHCVKGGPCDRLKKSGRFNNNQRSYLDEKFLIGQTTGIKCDPSQVARDLAMPEPIPERDDSPPRSF